MLARLPTENKTAQQKELALSLSKVISNIEDKRSFFGIVENIFFDVGFKWECEEDNDDVTFKIYGGFKVMLSSFNSI